MQWKRVCEEILKIGNAVWKEINQIYRCLLFKENLRPLQIKIIIGSYF